MSQGDVERLLGPPDTIYSFFLGQMWEFDGYGLRIFYRLSSRPGSAYELGSVAGWLPERKRENAFYRVIHAYDIYGAPAVRAISTAFRSADPLSTSQRP